VGLEVVDRRLIDLCASLTDGQLDTPVGVTRRHGVVSERATRLLAHLFQHQIHHRGQAHAMLSSTHVAPPQLDDFFCAGDADLRASELAELGTSERQLWSPPGSPAGEAPTRRELVEFLRAQPWAVQASVSQALSPQAAVIGVVVTDQLELFFDTLKKTREYQDLAARPEIALVIGWDEGRTVQLQGQVDEPASDELARLKERDFALSRRPRARSLARHRLPAGAADQGVDDVGYLASVISSLTAQGLTGPGQVYLVGSSNGAMLSYRFACEAA